MGNQFFRAGNESERRSRKREDIVAAAARVFAAKGFTGTLIADIAREAGIGKGTIYEYFRSKEELFFGVFEWFAAESGRKAKIDVSTLSYPASERLSVLGESLMAAWMEMKPLYSLSLEFWAAAASSKMRGRFRTALRETYREFRDIVEAIVLEGIERREFDPSVNPVDIAATLVGSWDALILQAWIEDDFDPMATGRTFMNTLLRGRPEDVRRDAIARIGVAGPGGYILSTACSAAPSTPPQNILQLRAAAEEAGG